MPQAQPDTDRTAAPRPGLSSGGGQCQPVLIAGRAVFSAAFLASELAGCAGHRPPPDAAMTQPAGPPLAGPPHPQAGR
jgi:hypothetical protein